jgi:hypothetical protein
VICRFRGCSTQLTAAQDLRGVYFCRPAHRSAEHTARRHDDEVTLRADALAVIRNITTAHLVGDEARILALAFEGGGLPRPRTS